MNNTHHPLPPFCPHHLRLLLAFHAHFIQHVLKFVFLLVHLIQTVLGILFLCFQLLQSDGLSVQVVLHLLKEHVEPLQSQNRAELRGPSRSLALPHLNLCALLSYGLLCFPDVLLQSVLLPDTHRHKGTIKVRNRRNGFQTAVRSRVYTSLDSIINLTVNRSSSRTANLNQF